MNKKKRNIIKDNISNDVYVEENNEIIFKKLMYNPLLRIAGMMILLIFSLVNNNRIIKLAALTSNAIFNNENIFGHITYYTILGATMGICLLVSLTTIIIKPKLDLSNMKVLRRSFQLYSIYDFIVFVLSTFVCLFFIIIILVSPCSISGSSMENTYQDGDRVLLWNIGYSPKDGDVIVFDSAKYVNDSSFNNRFYIKRIVAKEKDIITYNPISLLEGNLFVNNTFVEKMQIYEYNIILKSLDLDYKLKFPVPKNKVLVMGDNRDNSRDSRSFGFIDESEIIGKVLFRFFPFSKVGNPEPDYR